MDIGQDGPSTKPGEDDSKPFARPRVKRRRLGYARPAFVAVRPNPAHYVLDFSESSTRIERSVCNLVISDKRSVAVVGLPGCGKTVLLRGLAYYPEVQRVFRDGICLVHLGPEITVQATFTRLLEVMHRLGGSTAAKRVENLLDRKRPDGECMESIQRFLKEKRFLLILDNVCESNPNVLHILSILTMRKHARALGRMTILTSTRSVSIARSFAGTSVLQIPLYPPLGDVSRDIFCAHSAFDRSYIDSVCAKKDFPTSFILKKCSGMPLLLAVVGGAIKRLLLSANTKESQDGMWLHYQTYLTNNFDQFGEICGLFKMMDACLRDVSSSGDWNGSLTAHDAVCSLASFKKGIWVPLVILQRLWGLDKKEEAKGVVQSLARLCLVLQEMRKGKIGISIPDIVVDFCSYEAKQGKGIRIWHQRLLNSFLITTANGSAEDGALSSQAKMQRSTEEEYYLKQNVGYHLSQVISVSEGGSEISPSFLAAASKFFRNHLADDINGSTHPS
ncbi:NB-ARC protein [Gracilaria domingensis]|nr:NB-ARC protein [Gracilaria domingensis]